MKANYGDYPADYEKIVKQFYGDHLIDPAAVRYQRISVPVTMYWGDRLSGFNYAWRVCVTLTSGNFRDHYTSAKTDALLIRDGHVVEFFPNGAFGEGNFCSDTRRW